ncbi:hypothetical protein NKI15_19970 [Mesorhizobium sp. M0862]|uniref:hypothetical protein n=1 Tax=Mesorhizobium sp. M0862 TaxID=2957015 RepID=UPI00333DD99C
MSRGGESDKIPTVGEYRGIGLHNHQDAERLALVRREIDTVFDLDDIALLVEVCASPEWSPESRLLAAAKLKARHQLAAEDRLTRPAFDMDYVIACTGSLDSQYWRSPTHFGSLIEPGRGPHEQGLVPRAVPLDEERIRR